MRLLLKQYLSSLNERDQLDVILPDFLSESGFKVIYRPQRGHTEAGVDVAAIGDDPETGNKTLFLLSIKSGDLTRAEWNSGVQALKPSLDEILYIYIPNRIPKRYQNLPIKIALCFGGDIQGTVSEGVNGYINAHTKRGEIEFAVWNGDYIVGLIAGGILRESIFPKDLQSELRKSLAFVDDASVCVTHFQRVLHRLANQNFGDNKQRLTAVRQIYLILWNIYVWGREANNLEAAYLCGEQSLLWVWDICKNKVGNNYSLAMDLKETLNKFVSLNHSIREDYIYLHIAPYSMHQDALAASVASDFSLDVNLKLFDALGKTAMHGIWLVFFRSMYVKEENVDEASKFADEIYEIAMVMLNMINHNPVYSSPIRDDHAIEITLAGLFLIYAGYHSSNPIWFGQITRSCQFSFVNGHRYPCVYREYFELAIHPKDGDDYKREATIGSILYPVLAIWSSLFNDEQSLKSIADFKSKHMSHSTWQIWLPSSDTEEHLYRDSAPHGTVFDSLDFSQGTESLLEQVKSEIDANDSFLNLSIIDKGVWPMVLSACRLYRIPVPPQYWYITASDNN